MQMVRTADDDGVHILLFFKQFPVIAVGCAAIVFAGGFPRSVKGVHDLLAGFAAGDTAGNSQGVC